MKQQEDLIYRHKREAGYRKEEKRGGGGAKKIISMAQRKAAAGESSYEENPRLDEWVTCTILKPQ